MGLGSKQASVLVIFDACAGYSLQVLDEEQGHAFRACKFHLLLLLLFFPPEQYIDLLRGALWKEIFMNEEEEIRHALRVCVYRNHGM